MTGPYPRRRLLALAATTVGTAGALLLPASASIAAPSPRATAAAVCPNADMTFHSIRYYRDKYKPRTSQGRRLVAGLYAAQIPRGEAAVLCLTNNERAANGLAPLASNPLLRRAASTHALEAKTQRWWFGGADPHVNPKTGSTPETRIQAAGYCPTPTSWSFSENTYWGYGHGGTPAAAVRWWMNSPGHRANILDPEKKEIGVGVATGGATPSAPPERAGTFVQVFGFCS